MRTRAGFVSNSSSSSFVVIGQQLSMSEIGLDAHAGRVHAFGRWLSDGIDFFRLTPEMIEYLVSIPHGTAREPNPAYLGPSRELTFFSVHKIVDGCGILDRDDLPKRFYVYSVEGDYHSTEDLKTLKERYCGVAGDEG